MKSFLIIILLFISIQGQAQVIWKNDSLKRSDVIQFAAGVYYGTFQVNQNNSTINYLKFNGWERGFKAELQAKLLPTLSFLLTWKKLEQGIMMYYWHPDFYESYMLLNKRSSIVPAVAYTIRSKKKKELISMFVGVSFNQVDFSVPFPSNFNLSSPYSINNTGADKLNAYVYSNHSYLFGLSRGMPLAAGFSLHTFAEVEYTPKYAELDYTYYDVTNSPVVKKSTNFTFSAIQTRLGISVKW
jgi:hypothetical protein